MGIYNINPVELIAGSLPVRQSRLVEAWAELHTEELLAELKKFRFDEARLKEGMALITKTIELFAVQKKEFGEQLEASEAIRELTVKCKAAYNATLEIARTAFSTDGNAYAALMCAGKRKAFFATKGKP